jgi:hypothetical protein
MEGNTWISETVEPPAPKRKRKKYRRYPRPVGTDVEWQAILEAQGRTCALCDATEDLRRDHSYRSGKPRGWL